MEKIPNGNLLSEKMMSWTESIRQAEAELVSAMRHAEAWREDYDKLDGEDKLHAEELFTAEIEAQDVRTRIWHEIEQEMMEIFSGDETVVEETMAGIGREIENEVKNSKQD